MAAPPPIPPPPQRPPPPVPRASMQTGQRPAKDYAFKKKEMLEFQQSADYFAAYWDSADAVSKWRAEEAFGTRAKVYEKLKLPWPVGRRRFPCM